MSKQRRKTSFLLKAARLDGLTLHDFERELRLAGIDEAKYEILTLAKHASGLSAASLLAGYEDNISEKAWYMPMREYTSRRAHREPIQYILGKWDFYGDTYKVTRDTLIPRSDTETIVEFALSRIKTGSRIADLCCGSGIIGIALAKRVRILCDSVDISPSALVVAKENAESLGVGDAVRFIKGDVMRGEGLSGAYDMIISNPPYIRSDEIDTLQPEVLCEPRIALDGGDDGLDFYRAIIDKYERCLVPEGEFLFEIGYDEAADVGKIARSRGFDSLVIDDLSKNPRAVLMRRNNNENKGENNEN